jgi:hypothetical protein
MHRKRLQYVLLLFPIPYLKVILSIYSYNHMLKISSVTLNMWRRPLEKAFLAHGISAPARE